LSNKSRPSFGWNAKPNHGPPGSIGRRHNEFKPEGGRRAVFQSLPLPTFHAHAKSAGAITGAGLIWPKLPPKRSGAFYLESSGNDRFMDALLLSQSQQRGKRASCAIPDAANIDIK